MLKTILKLLLGTVLMIATQACAPTVGEPLDPDIINTAIAQTLEAVTPTSEPGIPVTASESPTPTETIPAPTATFSPSPIPLVTSTPNVTPGVPVISVSVPTNCRTGPGTGYERVGGLLDGEVAEVVGRSADGEYWIIRNPDRAGQTCWLWGEYATVAGNSGILPVYTPPPTPTPSATPIPNPDFEASYDGLERCTDTGWWVDLALENTGGIPFRSFAMTVRDIKNNNVIPLYSNEFTDRTGCDEISSRDNLPVDVTRIVSSPIFDYNLRGRDLRATITLCQNLRQSGLCVTKVIRFTP